MLGKWPSRLPSNPPKRARIVPVYPAHHAAHVIPYQLIPWLLAASLLLGLAMLMLAFGARGDGVPRGAVLTSSGGGRVLAQLPSDPNDFARDFFYHEIDAQTKDHSLWSFRETKREDGKLNLYDVCQTHQGQVERLIAVDGRPSNEQELAQEDARIQGVISDPVQVRQRQNKDHEDSEQARKLMRMFPDAFLFRYDGTQGSLVRLRFSPNPNFHPPDHASQVFHHMEGTVLVEPKQKRLAAIHGELTSEVKFFGGLLGYLSKGGTFNVQQEEVGPKIWEVSAMHVQMNGKALFFKTIAEQEDETYTDFKSVPTDTSLEQAAERLKNTPSESAQVR
jgi:hypothetical protein